MYKLCFCLLTPDPCQMCWTSVLVLCLSFSLQILFVSGLALVIGLERTFRFFFQRHKLKGSAFFIGGIFIVLIGWPMVGMILETYGFVLLFG